jgi:hypothetical protein
MAGMRIPFTLWDIQSVDKRFLMIKEPETIAPESADDASVEESARKINIVLNWFEYLKDRVPRD